MVKVKCSVVESAGALQEFHDTKGDGCSSPKENSSDHCHFDLSRMAGDGFLASDGVGLWWSLTQNCLLDWEEGGMGRRVEVIYLNFHWLVFLWHSSKREMASDCLFKVSSVHCRRYSSRKD